MKQDKYGWSSASKIWMTAVVFLAGLSMFFGVASGGGVVGATNPEPLTLDGDAKFIGAAKCKSCHKSEEDGNQFAAWENGPHAKAFATLGSDAAKAIAAEKGIADPQTADQCLQCHVTAFGVDEKMIKRGFKQEAGVQCESCHGPGETHMKLRFKAAAAEQDLPVGPEEVTGAPSQEVCTQCHNAESPTFKKFCFYERVEKIRHLRPGTDAGARLVCGCGDPCPCEHGSLEGCGVPQSELK